MPSRVVVEPVIEGGLQALRVTVTIPPGVLVGSALLAERETEGALVEAKEAVRRYLTRQPAGVAA